MKESEADKMKTVHESSLPRRADCRDSLEFLDIRTNRPSFFISPVDIIQYQLMNVCM